MELKSSTADVWAIRDKNENQLVQRPKSMPGGETSSYAASLIGTRVAQKSRHCRDSHLNKRGTMKASMKLVSVEPVEPVRLDEQMTELSLLLPTQQAEALRQAAQLQGVSMGRLVRSLLQQAVASLGCTPFGGRMGNLAAD